MRWFLAHLTMLMLVLIFAAAICMLYIEFGDKAVAFAAVIAVVEAAYFAVSFIEIFGVNDEEDAEG